MVVDVVVERVNSRKNTKKGNHMNYLILLAACVAEEKEGANA